MAPPIPTFTITQNNTAPALQMTLADANGPVDLTTATGVAWDMRNASDGTVKVAAGVCAIVTPAGGVVRYPWIATDTSAVGTYNGKATVTWADGTKTSFPTNATAGNNYVIVNVVDDAGTVG